MRTRSIRIAARIFGGIARYVVIAAMIFIILVLAQLAEMSDGSIFPGQHL